MTSDIEHLFMCLFPICISSLVKCPFMFFAHFLTGLLVVLKRSFEMSLCILDMFLSDMLFANIFSQSITLF